LEEQTTGPAREEGPSPGHQVWVDPLGAWHAAEGGRADVVETPFDVQEERGDFSFAIRRVLTL